MMSSWFQYCRQGGSKRMYEKIRLPNKSKWTKSSWSQIFYLHNSAIQQDVTRSSRAKFAKLEDLICNFINYGFDNFSRINIFKPQDNFGRGILWLEIFCLSLLKKKNISRASMKTQSWATILSSNFWQNKFVRNTLKLTRSIFMYDMVETLSSLEKKH